MTDQKYYGFKDGMPTGPDVERLIRKWPELSPGDRLDYPALEKILNVEAGTSRWRSITNAWRRRQKRDSNIIIECDAGNAFYVATADQVSSSIHGGLMGVGRKLKRMREKAIRVETKSDSQRATLDHQCLVLSNLERETKKTRMNLLPSTKAEERPKISAPKSSNCV